MNLLHTVSVHLNVSVEYFKGIEFTAFLGG
jgi:hypothetical protein